MLDALLSNAGTGATASGFLGQEEFAALQKSLAAGYGTDSSTFTGGTALRIQSLDTTMQATVQDNKHFALFNKLPKPTATATVDEWTEQYSVGGFLGGSTNTESGVATEYNGDYARQVGQVKYLSTYRKIPIVLQTANNIVDPTALESANGAKQLLTDVEYLMFEGDSSVVPTEFDGIRKQLENLGLSDHAIDMQGSPLNSIDAIAQAAETIFGIDNFGTPTDLFTATSVQTDLNSRLDPAYRVALTNVPNSTALGTHVSAVQTSYGAIATNQDVFIRDERKKKVFETMSSTMLAIAVANNSYKPVGVAVVANASGGASSLWTASNAGQYYYAVTGITNLGQSQAVVSAQVAVVAGGSITLTITRSAAATETGYVIYRSRLNGTNALTDLRELIRIPVAGATTVWTDIADHVPGSTNAYVLNLNPSDHAISWKQFLPMLKIPMAATNSPIIPWLQMICGYLRITKRRQHVMIKNIVPSGAAWKPFN